MESCQTTLFTTKFDYVLAPPPTEKPEVPCRDARTVPDAFVAVEPVQLERERPKATLRDVRAVRSLLYNRLLLEVAQRRIEKAEAVIFAHLLTQGGASAQIGPYLVEADATQHLTVTKTEDDGWYQPYFSELDTASLGQG